MSLTLLYGKNLFEFPSLFMMRCAIWDHLYNLKNVKNTQYKSDVSHDLVPFVQFKKREKHLWRSVTYKTILRNQTKLDRTRKV